MLLGDGGQAVALDALQDIGGVAALKRFHPLVVDLPHGLGHLVEKPAIVRDQKERACAWLPARFQVAGEPVDGADIEMVCGLVEHEDVPVANEQAREVDAAALTARELAYTGFPGYVGDEAV